MKIKKDKKKALYSEKKREDTFKTRRTIKSCFIRGRTRSGPKIRSFEEENTHSFTTDSGKKTGSKTKKKKINV